MLLPPSASLTIPLSASSDLTFGFMLEAAGQRESQTEGAMGRAVGSGEQERLRGGMRLGREERNQVIMRSRMKTRICEESDPRR